MHLRSSASPSKLGSEPTGSLNVQVDSRRGRSFPEVVDPAQRKSISAHPGAEIARPDETPVALPLPKEFFLRPMRVPLPHGVENEEYVDVIAQFRMIDIKNSVDWVYDVNGIPRTDAQLGMSVLAAVLQAHGAAAWVEPHAISARVLLQDPRCAAIVVSTFLSSLPSPRSEDSASAAASWDSVRTRVRTIHSIHRYLAKPQA